MVEHPLLSVGVKGIACGQLDVRGGTRQQWFISNMASSQRQRYYILNTSSCSMSAYGCGDLGGLTVGLNPRVRLAVRTMGSWPPTVWRHRFSAFWLRSSVVSVLISLISDTSPTRGPYIKLIFGAGRWNRGLLRPLHASTRYCSISGNGASPSHCQISNSY